MLLFLQLLLPLSVTAAVLRNGRFNCIGESSSGQRTFERNLVM